MKSRFLIIAAAFSVFLPGTGLAIENPAVRNPAGFGTLPQSSFREGLIRSPNPIGNIGTAGRAGGRYFRDIAPHWAGSHFEGAPDSSSLDSFVRRSAGSGYYDRYTGTYQPLYSYSGKATTTKAGQAGLTNSSAGTGGYTGQYNSAGFGFLPGGQGLNYSAAGIWGSGYGRLYSAGRQMQRNAPGTAAYNRGTGIRGPMSMTPEEIEQVILAETIAAARRKRMNEQRQSWMKQLNQAKGKTETGKNLADDIEVLQRRVNELEKTKALQPFQLPGTKKQGVKNIRRKSKYNEEQNQSSVDEQIGRQLDELQKSYERLAAMEPKQFDEKSSDFVSSVSAKAGKSESRKNAQGKNSLLNELPRLPTGGKTALSKRRTSPRRTSLSNTFSSSAKVSNLSSIELAARARAILGTYGSPESFADAKFNECLIAGEEYLKRGRYYRSADAYGLALIYKPDEPLAYIGKSSALFAAGDYVSSALFLSRAIAAQGQGHKKQSYGIQKILASGSKVLSFIDRDKLESRVADVERWQQKSGSADLQFLLGYIYYQMGRPDAAGKAIDGAYKKMPGTPTVTALKKVIDSKKRPRKD